MGVHEPLVYKLHLQYLQEVLVVVIDHEYAYLPLDIDRPLILLLE